MMHTPSFPGCLDPTRQFCDYSTDAVPVGRMGEMENATYMYLLSDYSSCLSGAVVVLDGGNLYMAGMFHLTKV